MVFIKSLIDSLTGKIKPVQKFAGQKKQDIHVFHIGCGDCNGCTFELQALNGTAYDIKDAGIKFVGHPADADLLLISGLITRAMLPYIEKSWKLISKSKAIVTIGSCAINRHIFASNYAILDENVGDEECILQIEGCPPLPSTIMDCLMKLKRNTSSNFYSKSPPPFSSSQELSGHQLLDDGNCDNSTELDSDIKSRLKPRFPKDLLPE